MMDEERQSTKPADSDVAPLTAEQMKETWEQMLSNTQNILQQNLTEENLSIPIAPFGLTPVRYLIRVGTRTETPKSILLISIDCTRFIGSNNPM